MADNTARQIAIEVAPQQNPAYTPQSNPKTAAQPQVKTLSKFDKMIMLTIAVSLFALAVGLLTTKVALINAQRQLQNTTNDIVQGTAKRNNLKQSVGELTSSDRLNAFAQEHGLTLKESNIRNVSK